VRFDRDHRSDFVEDRRGQGPAGGGLGGAGLWLLWMIFRRFGIVGVIAALVIFAAVSYLSTGGQRGATGQGGAAESVAGEEELVAFVSFVLDDAQRTWERELGREGRRYEPARLVLFTGRVDSACGLAGAAVGPFYCPRDRKVYIDLSFYRQLQQLMGAPEQADFAQAYVIAHEIGHHVQNLRGELERGGSEGAGRGSVRTELQADCYAGVWAASTRERQLLEAGDVEEAMRAAQAIGDDALQRDATGTVRPESWTHGSSAQRMRWFRRGFESGRLASCDTFAAREL
jgi:hypothetical protein